MANSYHVTDADGVSFPNPDVRRMRGVLESLKESPDADFPDVVLCHDNGHSLVYTLAGHMLWEQPGGTERLHRGCSVDRALACWQLLAEGDLEALAALPWEQMGD